MTRQTTFVLVITLSTGKDEVRTFPTRTEAYRFIDRDIRPRRGYSVTEYGELN